MQTFFNNLLSNQYFYMFLVLWELCWKGMALWKASKAGQKVLFVALLVLNTMGIFPIGYLVYRKIVEKKRALKEVK